MSFWFFLVCCFENNKDHFFLLMTLFLIQILLHSYLLSFSSTLPRCFFTYFTVIVCPSFSLSSVRALMDLSMDLPGWIPVISIPTCPRTFPSLYNTTINTSTTFKKNQTAFSRQTEEAVSKCLSACVTCCSSTQSACRTLLTAARLLAVFVFTEAHLCFITEKC